MAAASVVMEEMGADIEYLYKAILLQSTYFFHHPLPYTEKIYWFALFPRYFYITLQRSSSRNQTCFFEESLITRGTRRTHIHE